MNVMNFVLTQLKRQDWASSLPSRELAVLAALFAPVAYPPGKHLDTGEEVYLLLSGKIKILAPETRGPDLVIDILEVDFFEQAIFVPDTAVAGSRVVVTEKSQLLCFQRSEIPRVARLAPEILPLILASFFKRLDRSNRLVVQSSLTAEEKVAAVLREYAVPEGRNGMVVNLTHSAIANHAGTARETASRVIAGLVRKKLVVADGQGRIIVDLQKLKHQQG